MSTDPTPAPVPPPTPTPAAAEPVVDAIRNQRDNVGYLLTLLAVLFLVGGVMLAVRSNSVPATTEKKAEGATAAEDLLKGLPTDTAVGTQVNRFDYLVGAFGCALGLVITGAGAAYLLVSLRKPAEDEQRREARVFVLAIGGLLGAALILIGAWFFVRWSDSLVQWLDKGEMKEAKYTLAPLLAVVVGGLLVTAAVQPARAEERNNTAVRRVVYGSNLGLTVLALFVVLVIVNAVVAMRLPNKLDTTSSGIHTLDEQTVRFLEQTDQPIRAVAIVSESRPFVGDLRQLLTLMREANPGKFQVRFLSPALDAKEITQLRDKYPKADMSGSEGVLLVVGENDADANRHTYVRVSEFVEQRENPDGRTVTLVFNGEARLLREMLFLGESKKKPKAYFTQSSGELALAGGDDPKRSATVLAEHLRKHNYDVAPLAFDLGKKAEVPADATLVVVADPAAPVPPAGVEALRKYMTDPRPDGSKGKLVVLAGAQPGSDRKMLKTGLEPLLATFGVQLGERFVYTIPSTAASDPRALPISVNVGAVQAGNPVAIGFYNKLERGMLRDCREVNATRGGGPMSPVVLLAAPPGQRMWVQEMYSPNPRQTWQEILKRIEAIENAKTDAEAQSLAEAFNRDVQGPNPKAALPLSVLLSERVKDKDGKDREVGRVAVFGSGWFVSDEAVRTPLAAQGMDLMGSTLDWVRDRPVANLPDKQANPPYVMKSNPDNQRLVYVPGLLVMVVVIALGAGVWVIRRK